MHAGQQGQRLYHGGQSALRRGRAAVDQQRGLRADAAQPRRSGTVRRRRRRAATRRRVQHHGRALGQAVLALQHPGQRVRDGHHGVRVRARTPARRPGCAGSHRALSRRGPTPGRNSCASQTSFTRGRRPLPGRRYPHTGAVMSAKFGLGSTPVLNLQQGCSGFVYALAVADAFIRIGTYQRVLVVGAEALSTMLEYSDRGRDMAVLFADGAGAVVLQSVDASSRSGFISHHLHPDGLVLDKLCGEIYGSSTYPLCRRRRSTTGGRVRR